MQNSLREKMNKMYVLPSSEYCKKKKVLHIFKMLSRLGSTAHNKNLNFQWLQQDGNLVLANIKEVRKWVMEVWYAGSTKLSGAWYPGHGLHDLR